MAAVYATLGTRKRLIPLLVIDKLACDASRSAAALLQRGEPSTAHRDISVRKQVERDRLQTANMAAFRLRQYDCIGFDMDHTLCRYRLAPFFEMEYQALADYLIECKGYDAQLRRPMAEDADFVHKGLVLDVERGHFLKLSQHGQVMRATHGTRPMSDAEIDADYGPRRTNDLLRLMATDPVEANETRMQRKYRAFKDYFDLPSAVASARIVDLLDLRNGNRPLERYAFWRDVLCGLADMFNRDNLKINAGGYYPNMRSHPGKYLTRAGDALKAWLRDLHRRQVTFLISGSDPEYVECVASYCLGTDWKSYFDYVVCASKKPGFFTSAQEPRPFKKWHPTGGGGGDDDELPFDEPLVANQGAVYTHGNWEQLKETMAEYAGVERPKCLYFGDHLLQDVYAADVANMDVVAVVEELEAEASGDTWSSRRPSLVSRRWGSFFYDDAIASCSNGGESGAARINTLWACLVRKHARLCVSHVECVSDLPADRAILVDGAPSSQHEKFLGFLPNQPVCLT